MLSALKLLGKGALNSKNIFYFSSQVDPYYILGV